jgi:hypothetical protein
MKKDKLKKQKEDLLTVSDYLKLAQQVFNKWVRLRDQDQGCISCGNTLGSKYDAGHFWSAGGHSAVRFHPDNVHLQCQPCNTHLHGNIVPYRQELLRRIGAERLEFLEGVHQSKYWSIQELKEIKIKYTQLIKGLDDER